MSTFHLGEEGELWAHQPAADRAGGLRPEPPAESQPKALIPCAINIDDSFVERANAFALKHCDDLARLSLLQDMCAVMGLTIRVRADTVVEQPGETA